MAHPSPRERSYAPKDGSGFFFQDLCNWADVPEFRDFVLNGPGGRIAARLHGERTFLRAAIRKTPRLGGR